MESNSEVQIKRKKYRNVTLRKKDVKEEKKEEEKKPDNWGRFEKDGNILYNDMISKFDNMFDGDSRIKHFTIYESSCGCSGIPSEYKIDLTKYENNLQTNLIPWIKNEYKLGRLFEKTNWKPFFYCYNDMFLGYRIPFSYKQYYFQLILLDSCGVEFKECIDCKITEYETTFELNYYIWTDENGKQRPYNYDKISDGYW
jgi:hypothetical protein